MAGLRAWLRYAVALGCASALAAACGGTEFSSEAPTAGSGATGGSDEPGAGGNPEGGASTNGGTGGSAGRGGGSGGSAGSGAGTTGSGGGSTVLCNTVDDCEDDNPCSLDVCNANGFCEYQPKCGGAEPRCCDGECGQCCLDSDCPAINDCMIPRCFDGFCTNTPGPCEAEDEYCGPNGCMLRETCEVDDDCADEDPCSADTCVNGLCEHPACPDAAASLCCPGGCAACCSDSQCAAANTDPCKKSTCESGECVSDGLCPDGSMCCPSAGETSATCGECCGPEDCDDDGVACTDTVCRGGECGHEPDSDKCESGETCHPLEGCMSGACQDPSQCAAPGICEQVDCHDGVCRYDDLSCSNGTSCCEEGPLKGTCQACCSNPDCQDNSTAINCCQDDGQCHECCSDLDCQGVVANFASGGAIGIPRPCATSACDPATRKCVAAELTCPDGESCCPDGYCSGGGRECIALPE